MYFFTPEQQRHEIPNSSLKKIIKNSNVKHCSPSVFPVIKDKLEQFITPIIKYSILLAQHRNVKTISEKDLFFALDIHDKITLIDYGVLAPNECFLIKKSFYRLIKRLIKTLEIQLNTNNIHITQNSLDILRNIGENFVRNIVSNSTQNGRLTRII